MHFLRFLQSNAYLWLGVLFALVLIGDGFQTTDLGDFLPMSARPLHMALPLPRQFLYSSPFNILVASLTGLDTIFGFYAIGSVEILLMLFCVAFGVRRKFPDIKQQITFLTLLALTPLWLIVVKWIGKTDPVLIGGFFLCWALRSRWRVAFAVMMIAAHREVGSLMILSLYLLEDRKDHNLVVSLLLGNALHLLYQYGLLDHAPQSRAEFMSKEAPGFLHAVVGMPALYVMSMLSWYWVVILKHKMEMIEAGIMLVALTLALINADFTRDFILVALPALVFHAERVARLPQAAQWQRLWPLAPLQFQIADIGHVAFTNNVFLDWVMR